ncbi:magnesium transporter CorA family protein [Paenibacillus solisilvae]|uniref:Magnesium transporter CorA family protein n=1 Tax=Paenibacillus solisilvae TaxID=2486751 RepID=A0ABW0VWH9_9BACL
MMHRMLRFPSNWEWHVLHEERPGTANLSKRSQKQASPSSVIQMETTDDNAEAIHTLKQSHPEMAGWLSEIKNAKHNHIIVSELASGEPVLQGTLVFQASEDQRDLIPLHFWVTKSKIATIHSDYRLSIRLQLEPWDDKLNRCQTAPEAFFVMLGLILENFHAGLDEFETRLGELEQKMQKRNRTGLMNVIFERRYELLHWSHLFIPIREILGAAKEAFLDSLTEHEEYKRMEFKLDRIQELLSHYAMEIDTLLMMDDAISNFRGNDIMKTLTIFTALFTPATVVGGVWGMNFNRIPWASEPWGFLVVTFIIAVSTLCIYGWLWRKGWTGDLLKGRRPEDIVSSASTSTSTSGMTAEGRGSGDNPLRPRSSRISSLKQAGEEQESFGLPSRSNR